jgi:signal transduction histidine kinase/CheY-like chemotaxis protein/HD-like signal output (HDOD) protein
MDSIELKRRIKLMSGLPGLPPVVREVLVPAARMDFEALASHIAADTPLCQVLADAVPGAVDVSDAVRALEVNGLRRAVLTHVLKALFPAGQGGALDRAEFWQRASRCGEFAEHLALRLESPHADDAYAAGFLHNVGALVLDALAPTAYARVLEAVRAGGLDLLEAERRELGLDHTLAGKWVAENWGIPEPHIAVMWLHHHPVGALDDTCYPVQLIELVRLADTMTRMQAAPGGEVTGPNPHLLERLSITRSVVEDLLHPARPMRPEDRAALEPGLQGAHAHWQRRVLRLDLLEQFQARLAVLQHLGAVMDATAAAVREAFPAVWGCCCVTDEEFDCLEGRWWRATEAPATPFAAPLDAGRNGEAGEALPPLLDTVLPLVRDGVTPQGLPGLLVAPVLAEGRGIGHLVLDLGAGPLHEDDLSDLRLFGRAAGMTVAHLRAEQLLRTRNEEMAEALWRKEDVIQTRLRAARMAGIARLAAGASHEINNPLAIISGQAQMLLGRAVSAEQTRALESIIAQSRRASQILTDLMQFARPEEPRLEPMPLAFVLRQIADEVRPGLQQRGIQLVEDYFDRLPPVALDRRRFEQVLHHLIDNASEAMAARGGALTLRATPAVNRQLIKVQVIDTGPGIPAELHEEIFEPFFTTRQQTGATGLGLAVCHGIVDSHGGHLEVDSRPGKGATFSIVLPAAEEMAAPAPLPRGSHESGEMPMHTVRPSQVAESLREAARMAAGLDAAQPLHRAPTTPDHAPPPRPAVHAPEPVPEAQTQKRSRATILITDDDVDLREVLKETFQARGYDALGASDAMEAQAMLVGCEIDLVILDLRLPRKDGLALMRELRARHAHIPVIVVTSLATEEELSEARRLGAHACMHKPFELKRLLAEIEEALHNRHAA